LGAIGALAVGGGGLGQLDFRGLDLGEGGGLGQRPGVALGHEGDGRVRAGRMARIALGAAVVEPLPGAVGLLLPDGEIVDAALAIDLGRAGGEAEVARARDAGEVRPPGEQGAAFAGRLAGPVSIDLASGLRVGREDDGVGRHEVHEAPGHPGLGGAGGEGALGGDHRGGIGERRRG
jgi:hypothetical protein